MSVVTIGSSDGVELCKFIGTYLLTQSCTLISKNDFGFLRNDGLMKQEYINGQQIGNLRKKIVKIFKENSFKIDIEIHSKIVDFLGMTLSLINGSYKPYEKPNDTLLYVNKNSNYPPQIIKKLPKTIYNRLSRNSSNAEVFH